MDAPEPTQVTPCNEILPDILSKQIVLGHFGLSRRGVRSSGAVAHPANTSRNGHTTKLGSIGSNCRFLADASAGDGRGREIQLRWKVVACWRH